MISTFRVLTLLLVAVPFAAAVLVPFTGRAARRVALLVSLLHVGLTAAVVLAAIPAIEVRKPSVVTSEVFSFQRFEPNFVPGDLGSSGNPDGSSHRTRWTLLSLSDSPTTVPGPHVQFFIGVDGLNLWLLALTSLMTVAAILMSWDSVRERANGFYGWLFLLQCGTIGTFLSFDIILFYAFFELTLIPSFFLIGHWGYGSARRDAARIFFLYTLGGSLITLVGIVGVVLTNPLPDGQFTFSIPDLMVNVQRRLMSPVIGSAGAASGVPDVQFWLFVALLAGFAVKVPIWPFHTWQPLTYSEAPIGVTAFFSAVLAKLGTFGILRLVLPLTPDAAAAYGLSMIGTLGAIGILYGAFCAFGQKDLRLLFAYSSISHLGFLILGLFTFNADGLTGASLHMVNHGITSAALFALPAFLLDRYRTSDTRQFGGLMSRYPRFAVAAFLFCFASFGLPGLNNFVSEMLMLGGLFDNGAPGAHQLGLAVCAVFGIFLCTWYLLTMLRNAFFHPLREPPATGVVPHQDTNARETVVFGGLAVLALLLGFFPQTVIAPMKADVSLVSNIGVLARARVAGTAPILPELSAEPTRKPTGAK